MNDKSEKIILNWTIKEKIGEAIINPRGIKIDLSIIIPVYNKYNFTKSCLADLNQLPINHEIIIVDNGSSDETQKELQNFARPNFKYIRNDKNYGFARACNIGYTAARGENVMFLNNDIRVKNSFNDWTKVILEAIAANDNSIVGPTGGYVEPTNNFSFVYETSDPTKKINYMSGWCLSASRNTWKKLEIKREIHVVAADFEIDQLFSEEFGIAYFEDTDLGFRAKRMDIDFKFVDIPVIHFGKITSAQINTYELYSQAKKIFIKKWGSK